MELVSLVSGLVVTQVHTFVKIPQVEHLRSVHFIVCKLFLNEEKHLKNRKSKQKTPPKQKKKKKRFRRVGFSM